MRKQLTMVEVARLLEKGVMYESFEYKEFAARLKMTDKKLVPAIWEEFLSGIPESFHTVPLSEDEIPASTDELKLLLETLKADKNNEGNNDMETQTDIPENEVKETEVPVDMDKGEARIKLVEENKNKIIEANNNGNKDGIIILGSERYVLLDETLIARIGSAGIYSMLDGKKLHFIPLEFLNTHQRIQKAFGSIGKTRRNSNNGVTARNRGDWLKASVVRGRKGLRKQYEEHYRGVVDTENVVGEYHASKTLRGLTNGIAEYESTEPHNSKYTKTQLKELFDRDYAGFLRLIAAGNKSALKYAARLKTTYPYDWEINVEVGRTKKLKNKHTPDYEKHIELRRMRMVTGLANSISVVLAGGFVSGLVINSGLVKLDNIVIGLLDENGIDVLLGGRFIGRVRYVRRKADLKLSPIGEGAETIEKKQILSPVNITKTAIELKNEFGKVDVNYDVYLNDIFIETI